VLLEVPVPNASFIPLLIELRLLYTIRAVIDRVS